MDKEIDFERDLAATGITMPGGEVPRVIVWLVMKVDHTATPIVHAVCADYAFACELVKVLKGDSLCNHALCFRVPYYGTGLSITRAKV